MAQRQTWPTSAIHLVTSALRSVQTTSLFTARAGPTRPILEAIGSAVRARMVSGPASPTIGTWALASDSATDSGSGPGLNPGGVRTDGAGATITSTITLASITSISTIIGTRGLSVLSTIMVLIRGTA